MVGYWTYSNSFSLVVVEMDDRNETATIAWSDNLEKTKERRIKYTRSGRPYINFSYKRWYFDNCMRF